MLVPMIQVHLRPVPAAGLATSVLVSAFCGFHPQSGLIPANDKVQHFISFFCMALSFYWLLDVSKRRATQLSLTTMLLASVVSEYAQAVITPSRLFDPMDIAANIIGSLAAIGLSITYHGRMLHRKREAKYASLGMNGVVEAVDDLEMGINHEGDDDQSAGSDDQKEILKN